MISRAARGVYDILHFEHAETYLPFAKHANGVPIVCRIHDPIAPWFRELLELYDTPNQHFVSISNNQRRDAPDLPYLANIYNGTDVHLFPFSDKHDDYLLYVGRVVQEKGVKEALDVARETGHRLLIIGPTYPESQGYFDQYIKPHLNDQILYLGFIEQNHLPKYYQKAKALLTPVQREEPFGLTTIEAMACGTPVISLNRGAAPEIIKHGKTGYIVKSISEMMKAVGKIDKIDRRACRDRVKEYFSLQTMVDAYEIAFTDVLQPTAKLKRRTKYVGQQIKKQVKRLKLPQPRDENGKQTRLML
jgi:glycosyltransferase involved in cell wall biosynthesis